MNIGKVILKGAARQFGAEFGRSGANVLLNGSNAIKIQQVSLNGRIKPSDNEIVVLYKELYKLKSLTSNKGNLVRLRKIHYLLREVSKYSIQIHTHHTIGEFLKLTESKWEEITSIIDNDYEVDEIEKLSNDIKTIIESRVVDLINAHEKYESDKLQKIKEQKEISKRNNRHSLKVIGIVLLIIILFFSILYFLPK